ncbi:MAG: S1/P1 nuclease [Spirochaetes bacterium]|nr:S1/P1 nuclease [Spirochaetota bacterium]
MRLFFCIAFASTIGADLFAWGLKGHRIVARIAEHQLSEKSRAWVQELLANESLPRIANEPDHWRSNPAWNCAATFHYTSVDDGEIYSVNNAAVASDIVPALVYFEKILRQKEAPHERRIVALKWLVHLIGDLHQPLHVGRTCDKGGNTIDVLWFGKKTNLHKVWDSQMLNDSDLSYSEYAEFLNTQAKQPLAEIAKGSYSDWADEAPIVRADVYLCFGKDGCCAAGKNCPNDHNSFGACESDTPFLPSLGYAYTEKQRALVERQLLRGGIRLASILNSIAAGEESASAKLMRQIGDLDKKNGNRIEQCFDAALKKN